MKLNDRFHLRADCCLNKLCVAIGFIMDNKLEQIVEQVTKDFIGTDVLPLFRDLVNQCKMEITRKLKSFGNKSALGDLDAKMADSAVDLQKSKENNNQSVAVVEPGNVGENSLKLYYYILIILLQNLIHLSMNKAVRKALL